MKGRYGVAMNTYGHILPGSVRLSRVPRLSGRAKQRLQWIDYFKRSGNARLTCRYFGIPAKTFYKWYKRYQDNGIGGLENRTRRPLHFRQSKIETPAIQAVIRLRKQYPMYSKYKIAILLHQDEGIRLSPSTIGRILVKYNLFFPTPVAPKKKRYRQVLVKQRLSPYYRSVVPGDVVEADMKDISFLGKQKYLFVGIDCVTKRLAVHVGSTSSSLQASRLLTKIQSTFPYPVQHLRVDNGSENLKEFHRTALELGITENFTRPYHPKDKPFVERVIGTIEREFIQQGKLATTVAEQQRLIEEWVTHYNTKRPHQSLCYLTPEQFERTLNQKQ